MEVMQVVGRQTVNFTAQDGNQINGTKLFVLCAHPYVDGQKSDSIFVSDKLRPQLRYWPQIGDEIIVDFNRYGKVSNIDKCP